jgi:hypothetical protein
VIVAINASGIVQSTRLLRNIHHHTSDMAPACCSVLPHTVSDTPSQSSAEASFW